VQLTRAQMVDGVPSARFGLALLGRFELTGPDGAINLASGKLAGLLAYLACTAPRPQSREKLSALLWGSHFDAQAKQNLRQALARLRRVLGQDTLQGDGEVVWLNAAAIESDVSRFEALIREGSRDALSAAADLYRGPLVDDVAVREEGWSEWLAPERERLLDLALGALVRLGEQELAAGRAEHALKAGRRAIALNNMREDAHRLVVQALVAAGRKAEALKHYQDLASLLKRELNAEPDAATRSLVAELGRTPPPSGSPAAKIAPPASGSHETPSERRQLTIIACNMVNTVAFSALHDPEDMRDLIATFHKVVADAVLRFDGFVAQYLNDGVRVYFGYPTAREHDTEQAVRAGLAICDAIGSRLRVASGVNLQARVGIATGLVVVGDQLGVDDAGHRVAIGETPDLAARLQAAAAPGTVLIAASTHRLVDRMFDCRALGASETKGLPQLAQAWQVIGEAAGVSRFEARRSGGLSPFVGRLEEIELLLRRWQQAKSGEGRVVLLSGEPGIGKSRIAESLLARLDAEPLARLRHFCSPHHAHSSLYPFIAQLEHAAGFEPGSDAGARLDRLEALLRPTSKNASRDVSLLAELLGVPANERYPALATSPQQKREMVLTAFLDRLDGMAARGPLLIVFEDAHWIDPTSLDLLDRMVARAADLPVLVVITFRLELEPTWIGQPHVTTLPLNRLGRRDSASIIGGVAREKAMPDTVVEQVLAQADGVPLFIEELTTTLLESGLLRETADSYVLARTLSPPAIPTTLQASLSARLDRLGLAKDVAVTGAAIGREFSYDLIAAVSALAPMDLDAALERLVASGLVYRRGVSPDTAYSFKHALVQDAAYATMLKSRRRQLHADIAKALLERFPAVSDSNPEVIARHFTEAGLACEAIASWAEAGRLAYARWANREAVQFFEQALHVLETLPESRKTLEQAIDLRFDLKRSLVPLGEFERILVCLREADRPARALGDQQRLGQLSVHMSHTLALAGDLREAIAFGENAQAVAESLGDVPLQVTGSLYLGAACLWTGDYRRAEGLFVKVLRLLEGDLSRERFGLTGFPAVIARCYLVWICADQGKFEEGIVHGQEAIRLAEVLDDPYNLTTVCWYLAYLRACRGELDQAVGELERALAMAREWNQSYMSVLLTGMLGHVYALSGRTAEGIPLLEQGLSALEKMGHRVGQPNFLIFLGEACLLADRHADAFEFLARAQVLSREGSQRGYEARALQLLGNVATRRDSPGEAEGYFRDGLALAEEIGMRPLIAHCHHGLGRLHQLAGAHQQAAKHFMTAAAMYRELDMPFWIKRAEAQRRP
jgi:DNA-binding SARP family transcriptional activator